VGDAGPVRAPGGSGRDVPGRVRREPALLPEPGQHPHGQLLAHHPRLSAGPAVRQVRMVRRRLDARDVAARCRLPNGALRQVPRWLPALGGDRLRPTRLGPVGGVRALGAGGLHPDDRRGATRVRTWSGRPRDGGVGGRGRRVRAGHDRTAVPRARHLGAARPGDPLARGRGRVREPALGAAAVVRRGGRLRQAGMGRDLRPHRIAGSGDRRLPPTSTDRSSESIVRSAGSSTRSNGPDGSRTR
jgi:hypothetical protein